MDKTFVMDIITPDQTAMSREVTSIVVPATEGYLGILANHSPLMAELKPGKIQVKEPGDKKAIIIIGGGFMDVNKNVVTILADSVDFVDEQVVTDFSGLNLAEAEKALKEARKRVAEVA